MVIDGRCRPDDMGLTVSRWQDFDGSSYDPDRRIGVWVVGTKRVALVACGAEADNY